MGKYSNSLLPLGVLAGVAIGLLLANWSPMRAVIYAVLWCVAAVVLLVRDYRRDASEPRSGG
ncbi:hypothetical protein HLB23_37190 [Nocardia uniformis]|uniref:Uncharacterized protein n=1 Tax=Nocardia uniformis TaxID=53432 RepID=A0A849CA49_9NOCA|nr:hypothetical protein [Nocardia uniformis]NNH75422.1 hypothetical protein [Nocardia uniformis]